MKIKMTRLIQNLTLLLLLSLGPNVQAGVEFLAHFNKSLDTDFIIRGNPKAGVKGVVLTTGRQGYSFPDSVPAPEAADIGYSGKVPEWAGLAYDSSGIDVRQGTIQMWVKTSWDWKNTDEERLNKVTKNHNFLQIKLKGGVCNSINLYFACDEGHSYTPHLTFLMHDGKKDYLCNVRVGPEPDCATDFKWQKDTWHYIVATWTPTKMALYADGKKLRERTFETPMDLPLPEGPLVIGNNQSAGQNRSAQALIDEVRILDFPLDEQTVLQVPQAELTETIAGAAVAASGPASFYHPDTRRYYAYALAEPPVIDGDLSDKAWGNIPSSSGFVGLGLESKLVRYQSEVKAAWDKDNLYIAVFCYEDFTDRLRAEAKPPRNSAVFGDDAVELFVSPSAEGKVFFQYGVNSLGISYPLVYETTDGGRRGKPTTPIRTAARKCAGGWSVEAVIPFQDIKATPRVGDQWHWNVCRDRRVAGLEYSSMNFVTSSFLEPSDFSELLFAQVPKAGIQEEDAAINRQYLERSKTEIADFIAQIARERRFTANLSPAEKQAQGLTGMEDQLAAITTNLQQILSGQVTLKDWNAAYVGLAAAQQLMDKFSRKTLSAVSTISNETVAGFLQEKPGVFEKDAGVFLVSDALAAAVDKRTGMLIGIWEKKTGRKLVAAGYDIYNAETRQKEWMTDERLNQAGSCKAAKDRVRIKAVNPDLPGITLSKDYFFAGVDGEDRILCCRTEWNGRAKETTLLKVTSNTIFEEEFRKGAFYDRLFICGTAGELRQQLWAREIKEPLMQRAVFISTCGRAQFSAFDPVTQCGLAQYLYKVDDRWIYPEGAATMSWWHPFGWKMAGPAAFLKRNGRAVSFESRYHLFHGDRLVFHREYLNLPEHRAVMEDWTPHPLVMNMRYPHGVPGLAHMYAMQDKYLVYLHNFLCRPNEAFISLTSPDDRRWPLFPASDDERVIDPTNKAVDYPCKQIKDVITELHRSLPKYKEGFYHFIYDIWKGYKEHPEWVLRDKNGKDVSSCGYPPDRYSSVSFCPEYVSHVLQVLLREVDYFNEDLVYLDFGTGGWQVDWTREAVFSPHVSADFEKQLHAELAKRGKMLWLNSATGQYYHDIGYHEGVDCHGPWRISGNELLMRKLYTRKGTVCVPLFWKYTPEYTNEERYRNLVLASGLKACGLIVFNWVPDPFQDKEGKVDWIAQMQYSSPVQAATRELIASEFVDIGLAPAWWRDFETEYEGFTLKQGNSWLLNVISHYKDVRDGFFTLNPKLMGLAPDKPVFCWEFAAREQKDFVKASPQPPGWDRMFKEYRFGRLKADGDRLEIKLAQLTPETARMTCLTQVPAFIYSGSGEKCQLLLPDNLGCSVGGAVDEAGKKVNIKVSANQPIQVLAYWDAAWGEPIAKSAANQNLPCKQELIGGGTFALFDVDKGEHEVTIAKK